MSQQFQKLLCLIFIFAVGSISCQSNSFREELQITHDLTYNHLLDNNDNFSPDDQWLVYDTRTDEGGIGACSKIEKVNIFTGKKVVLYELKQNKPYGPGVGAVSYSHTANKIVFIHGLMNVTEQNPYQQWHRSGVIVEDAKPNVSNFMDSRDVTFPFTPGALRGGTHRHEWCRDGGWIGYTYNDAIMKHLEDSTGIILNLRTIGVSKLIEPVKVDKDPGGENIEGEWFSVLVVKVVENPKPGSDEISKASSDSWVGTSGYKKANGTTQRARAFIGIVKNDNGEDVDEVFVVDIPDNITRPGKYGPLEGTQTTMPAPPLDASQRRLTFTDSTKFPGCEGVVRNSSDGSKIAFQAFDKNGIKQIFTISPLGGMSVQQTFHKSHVQSGVRWHYKGNKICYVWENRIIVREIGSKNFMTLTKPTDSPPSNLVWSHDGNTIAYNKKMTSDSGQTTDQIFVVKM